MKDERCEMTDPDLAEMEAVQKDLHTILGGLVLIPVTCDHCGRDTDHTLEKLKQLSTLECRHCRFSRQFTQAELTLTHDFLARLGYHFSDH